MIDKVMRAVARNLKKEYPEYLILMDYLEQGFGKAMFLEVMSVRQKLRVSSRKVYRVNLRVSIYNEKSNNDFMHMGARMYEILDTIEVDNIKYKASRGVFDIFNYVGRFLVTYEIQVNNSTTDIPRINSVSVRNGVKNG